MNPVLDSHFSQWEGSVCVGTEKREAEGKRITLTF